MSRDSFPSATTDAVKCDLAVEVLRSYGVLLFAATGWSMLPTIFPGDLLAVERFADMSEKGQTRASQIKLGDVILARRADKLCAHRVVAAPAEGSPAAWITQGDAMAVADPPVHRNELLGRVVSVTRNGRRRALRAKLNVLDNLIAAIVRRSFFAARVLMYLHKIGSHKYFSKPVHTSRESVTAWQL
jgi:hypothetical protein